MGMNSKAMCLPVVCAVLMIFVPTPVKCGVSLGFIIDDTGSMSDDIDGVSFLIINSKYICIVG